MLLKMCTQKIFSASLKFCYFDILHNATVMLETGSKYHSNVTMVVYEIQYEKNNLFIYRMDRRSVRDM